MTDVMGTSAVLNMAGLGLARTKDYLVAKPNLVENDTAVWSTVTYELFILFVFRNIIKVTGWK